jgi:hypothetical protein
MYWVILALLALSVYTALVNAGPVRCPSCRRINVLQRKRTGRRREERDSEGDLRCSHSEYLCRRCGCLYWIVWDDFTGCRTMSADENGGAHMNGQ